LRRIVFSGDEFGFIKISGCGAEYKLGDEVEHDGRRCVIQKIIPSLGLFQVRYPAADLHAGKTALDISHLGLGLGGSLIAAAFLPRFVKTQN
jgi:hypothetical protein